MIRFREYFKIVWPMVIKYSYLAENSALDCEMSLCVIANSLYVWDWRNFSSDRLRDIYVSAVKQ